VAQVGTVIGRGFSYGLLRAVAGIDDAPLQGALEKLADADIVLVQGLPPESDYRFKHALIQDAAYENLLKSRRAVIHRRIAEAISETFPIVAAVEPEFLAHHFTQAGIAETAIEWWNKAAEQALQPLGLRRGDRPSGQGDRLDRQSSHAGHPPSARDQAASRAL
jgi:predicted ATPase